MTKQDHTQDLITLSAWRELPPKTQGYALYMQAELPGSELKGQKNPYSPGTEAFHAFNNGAQVAILEAQDGDEEP
jgi:hypothetical protein